jgi:hypothetical protein
MAKMDAEFEAREAENKKGQKKYMTEKMQLEKDNEPVIKAALARSRALMTQGNCKGAVLALEGVRSQVGYSSDMGGEVLLDLAMALETVDRIDEARDIYGQLAADSWNPKIRRNALSLISGLDIVKQIRSQVSGKVRPAMDAAGMKSISLALEKGLTNEWDDYKKKEKKTQLTPWLDQMKETDPRFAPSATSLSGAYNIMIRELSPLKKVSNDLLRAAFKRLSTSPAEERTFYSMYKVDRILKQEKVDALQRLREEKESNTGSAAAVLAPPPPLPPSPLHPATCVTQNLSHR